MKIAENIRFIGGILVSVGILVSAWKPYSRIVFSLLVIGTALLMLAYPSLDDNILTIKDWIKKKAGK
ncbi:hypothetical protein COV19_03440 [Candidatus Woesearchaeota archaeon CG10_big_fil_rev_8_21_14_0_10_44_13]|nr:MAG: hypothetical protein COV19_03440 [Candidatus Woesearchaeota archaeon CG10_big_fil_rev_8_21_14_0_10_44_13]